MSEYVRPPTLEEQLDGLGLFAPPPPPPPEEPTVAAGDDDVPYDLSRARRLYEQGKREMPKCHECGGNLKVYKYRLGAYSSVLVWLLLNEKKEELFWLHVPSGCADADMMNGGGDYAKCAHWGLIEQRRNDDPKKRDSGVWRLTDRGRAFVREEITVPAKLYYAPVPKPGRFLCYEPADGVTTIREALGEHFDFRAVMA